MDRENAGLVTQIAIMKSMTAQPDKIDEYKEDVEVYKQIIKKSTKELAQVEKDLNSKMSVYENEDIALSQVYSKIKSLVKKTNSLEGRKIQEIMSKLDKVINYGYSDAVQAADKSNPDTETEEALANVYKIDEKVIFTDHQLKISRKHLSKAMTEAQKLEYYEELKEYDIEAAKQFHKQAIVPYQIVKKKSIKKNDQLKRTESNKSIKSKTNSRTIITKESVISKSSGMKRVQSAHPSSTRK